jgi:uncharacterized protein YggU (UPF0235/DUF167 family)
MIVEAKVKTNQSKFSVKKNGVWVISCTSPAESNRANVEIIKELSKKFKKVRILRGLKSKKKFIEID